MEDAGEVRIYPSKFELEVWMELSDMYRGRLRVMMSDVPSIKMSKQSKDDIPELLCELLHDYISVKASQGEQK